MKIPNIIGRIQEFESGLHGIKVVVNLVGGHCQTVGSIGRSSGISFFYVLWLESYPFFVLNIVEI